MSIVIFFCLIQQLNLSLLQSSPSRNSSKLPKYLLDDLINASATNVYEYQITRYMLPGNTSLMTITKAPENHSMTYSDYVQTNKQLAYCTQIL